MPCFGLKLFSENTDFDLVLLMECHLGETLSSAATFNCSDLKKKNKAASELN